MRPLKIYMGDLTHDTIILVSDTIPINIGFIGAYAKHMYGDLIDISLFKYPQSMIDAIKDDPPDVIALSNYSWNSHLSERIAEISKQFNHDVVTVQGGTNFPHESSLYTEFLLKRPCTDFHVELEGEIAFSNLIARILKSRDGEVRLFDDPVGGCVFIHPDSRYSGNAIAIKGPVPERIRDLDEIPSPYLTGLMDHFFDGRLTPFLETNRGCPFKCTFCHTGNDYFQKTNMFSIERIRQEIEYIAPRVSSRGIVNLHIADTNFGMYPRDRDICIALKEVNQKYGWPLQIMATTGKNNKERVIDITGIMGQMFAVNMSVQSMDSKVLANIKRDNIKLDHYSRINDYLNQEGRGTKGELIIGMPGETKETFLEGVRQLIESGISTLCIYTLMLLNGTEFQDPNYRAKFGIMGKFRIVPLDFGEYDGAKILDYEEVGVQTDVMAFDDYLYLRGFSLLVESLHNSRPFDELFRYALSMGIGRFDFLRRIFDNLNTAPIELQSIMERFLDETKGELWDSEEELVSHYQNDFNYKKLANGEVGGNLIYKYKSESIAFAADHWVDFLARLCKEIVSELYSDLKLVAYANEQIDILTIFCKRKLAGLLDVDGDVSINSLDCRYDVVGWLNGDETDLLDEYKTVGEISYQFYYTDEQLKARTDQFKRYGTNINAISKIVTRVSNVESMFRKIKTSDGDQILYDDTERDRFVRYTLSG